MPKSKINRHTKTKITSPNISIEHLEVINIDIVGPLEQCTITSSTHVSYKYLLTCIDRNTKWIEALPMIDATAKTIAWSLLYGWIARFWSPNYR